MAFAERRNLKIEKVQYLGPMVSGLAEERGQNCVYLYKPYIMQLTEEGPLTALHHEVLSYEIDFRKRMRLSAILNLFQELANQNAERLGFGFDKLMELRCFWVLSRLRLEVERLPRWTEKVVVKTWPGGVEGLFARRDWLVEKTDGEVLVRATSAWLLVDLDKRRPLRIEQRLPGFTFADEPSALDHDLPKLSSPAEAEAVWQHRVRYADLDQNRHVNNVRYVDWMMNAFALHEHEQHAPRSFEINILAEAQEGDDIQVLRKEQQPGVWSLAVNKSGGKTSALAQLCWD